MNDVEREQKKHFDKHLLAQSFNRNAEFWLKRLPDAGKVHLNDCTAQWDGEDEGYDRL